MRTTSIASGVVTRRPPRNSAVDAEPAEHRRDLRAAAVHHDHPDPAQAEEDDVVGEGGLELVVDHRVAAVLDDDGAAVELLQPRQRLDQGAGAVEGIEDARVPDACSCSSWFAAHVEYSAFSWT